MGITAFYNCRGEVIPFDELHQSNDQSKWSLPLPLPLVRSLSRQRRSYCDVSVTELVGPPQLRILKQRHDYAVKPSSLIWQLTKPLYSLPGRAASAADLDRLKNYSLAASLSPPVDTGY